MCTLIIDLRIIRSKSSKIEQTASVSSTRSLSQSDLRSLNFHFMLDQLQLTQVGGCALPHPASIVTFHSAVCLSLHQLICLLFINRSTQKILVFMVYMTDRFSWRVFYWYFNVIKNNNCFFSTIVLHYFLSGLVISWLCKSGNVR